MEDSVVVVATGGESEEVLAGFGAELAEKLDFYIAVCGVQGNRHSIINYIQKSRKMLGEANSIWKWLGYCEL